jgi:hypothetical protein
MSRAGTRSPAQGLTSFSNLGDLLMRSKLAISALAVASLFGSTLIASAQSQPRPARRVKETSVLALPLARTRNMKKVWPQARARAAGPTKAARGIHRMTTKATRGIHRIKSVLVRKTPARCIDILSRGRTVPSRAKAPEQSGCAFASSEQLPGFPPSRMPQSKPLRS